MPLVQPVIGCIYLKNLQGLRDTLSREIKAPGLRTAQVNPTLLVTNQDLLLGNNQSSRPPSPPPPAPGSQRSLNADWKTVPKILTLWPWFLLWTPPAC